MSEKFLTITIAGIKHSGKSTLGKALARKCGVQFYDVDEVISLEHGKGIRELFRSIGEDKFRQLEAETVSKIADFKEDKVISLGGGAVTNSYISSSVWDKLGTKVMVDVSDEIAEKRVFFNGVPAYLEKYDVPQAALKEINAARRREMKRLCSIVYMAEDLLSPAEQSERFHTFLKQKDII